MSGHKPIQPGGRRIMNALKGIDDALNGEERPKKWGFALLVVPFDEPGRQNRMNYIWNGKRDDVLVAIKELAARWEGRYAETDETVSSCMKPLPCPFCGEEPELYPKDPKREGDAFGQVRCENDDCPAQPVVNDDEGVNDSRGSAAYIAVAVSRWNQRV